MDMGIQQLTLDGRTLKLDWGNKKLTVRDTKGFVLNVDNQRLAYMLGKMKLVEFLKKEINKTA